MCNFTAVELAEAASTAKVRGLHSWVLVHQEKTEEGRSGLRQLRSNGLTVRSLGVAERSLWTSQRSWLGSNGNSGARIGPRGN